MKQYFNHEKLQVYNKALDFVSWSNSLITENKLYKYSVADQLDRASTSIVLNIAEGNGKYSSKDKCRYFDIAKASSLECSACLDIIYTKNSISEKTIENGKEKLKEIVSMLYGLIKSNYDRICEPDEGYENL
ncbi:MAG: four helix bundle protein [Ignavibacteria bacterium]|nr:four helix bundle protein [Ignavibacteria bacterium]